MNSKACDYVLKQITSVYGNRYYSYADQFLKEVPLPGALRKGDTRTARISKIAEGIVSLTTKKNVLRDKLKGFPSSFNQDVKNQEFLTVKELAAAYTTAKQIVIRGESTAVQKALYGYSVAIDGNAAFEFTEEAHAQYLCDALSLLGSKTVETSNILKWHLPIRSSGAKQLQQSLKKSIAAVEDTEEEIGRQEAELDRLVYEGFELSQDAQSVIEDFLIRYSNRSRDFIFEAEDAAIEEYEE